MTQVFIIINGANAQLCYYFSNVIDKIIMSLESHIYDFVERKRYIASREVDELTNVFKKVGVTWAISDNVGNISLIDANKYLTNNTERLINAANTHYVHNSRLHEIHESRRNTIRISKQLDMVKVELPMSLYSFHILNKLKKSYSLDSYAWNFIGEKNIAKLFETCKLNNIGIIQEINDIDFELKSGDLPLN